MARIESNGLGELMLSMGELEMLPDSAASEMLQAGGEVVANAQRSKYRSMLGVRTGNLADSIKVSKMKTKNGTRYVTVYPQGTHHTYGNGKIATNNDVAFIHEYGAPGRGISAKGIMRAANEESEESATAAEAQVYDNFLKSKNL